MISIDPRYEFKASQPWVLWLVIGVALVLRAEQRWHFPNIYLDNLAQAAVYENWEEGRGWIAFDEDQGKDASMHRFPPLYPLSIGLVHRIFPIWTHAIRILDILLLTSIFFIFYSFMDLWKGREQNLLWWFFAGLSLAPWQYPTGSGLMALLLLLASTYLFLRWKKKSRIFLLWLSAVLLGLTPWVRPAYLPFLALIPLFLIREAWLKRKFNKLSLILSLGLLLGLSGLGLIYWQSLGPNLIPREGGFYFEHLRLGSPFFLKSFLYWNWPQEVWLEQRFPARFPWLRLFWNFLNLLALVAMIRDVWGQKDKASKDLGIFLLMLMGLNVLFLALLSILQAPEEWNPDRLWTYVSEDRYYLPAMLAVWTWTLYRSQCSLTLRRIFTFLTLAYLLVFLGIRFKVYVKGDHFAFDSSYTAVLESALLFYKKNGINEIRLPEDPHHYLLEAYDMKNEPGSEGSFLILLIIPKEDGKEIPEGFKKRGETRAYIWGEKTDK